MVQGEKTVCGPDSSTVHTLFQLTSKKHLSAFSAQGMSELVFMSINHVNFPYLDNLPWFEVLTHKPEPQVHNTVQL